MHYFHKNIDWNTKATQRKNCPFVFFLLLSTQWCSCSYSITILTHAFCRTLLNSTLPWFVYSSLLLSEGKRYAKVRPWKFILRVCKKIKCTMLWHLPKSKQVVYHRVDRYRVMLGVIIAAYPGAGDVAAAHGLRGNYHDAGRWGAGDLLSKASRAEPRTPVLNASEEPVLHQITCNQFRDLHVSTSAPPLDWRHADKLIVPVNHWYHLVLRSK